MLIVFYYYVSDALLIATRSKLLGTALLSLSLAWQRPLPMAEASRAEARQKIEKRRWVAWRWNYPLCNGQSQIVTTDRQTHGSYEATVACA